MMRAFIACVIALSLLASARIGIEYGRAHVSYCTITRTQDDVSIMVNGTSHDYIPRCK